MGEFVAVTGAAGKTGRAVTAALSRRGIAVRAVVHRAEQAREGVPGANESVPADFSDQAAFAAAVDGASALYLIAPNMHPDEVGIVNAVIGACTAAGVRRLVYHSVIHPFAPAMPHHMDKARSEAALHESDLEWTILQPASYFENVYGVWDSVRGDGVWPLPYSAHAPFTPVALVDVAEVAAVALTERRHRFATYELAGPELLTTAEMADIAAEVLDHDIRVRVDSSVHAAMARPPRLQAMFDYYDAHGICGNPTVLAGLLTRPATTWRDWVASHR